jgi:hypothetical protein
MPDRGRTSRFAALCLIVAGCADEGKRLVIACEAHQPDSAGMVVVATPGTHAHATLDWAVDATSDLAIGVAEGAEAYQFHRIGDVAQLPDGRVLVVDGGSRELRFFSHEGEFLQAAGRHGEGPGEFRGVPRLARVAGHDSLVVFDPALQRFSVFLADGTVATTHAPLTLERSAYAVPWGDVSLHRVTAPVGVVSDRVLTLHSYGLMGEAGVQPPEPSEFRLVDPAGGTSDIVDLLTHVMWYNTQPDELGQVGRHRIPFAVAPSAAVGRDGFVLIPSGAPEVRVYDRDGRWHRTLRLDEAPVRPAPRDLDIHIEHLAASARTPELADLYRREYRHVPLPDTMAVFDDVLVDDIGWVWARLYMHTPHLPQGWVVFDPDGCGRGIVTTPAGFHVHQVGPDFVLGVRRDELGIEAVLRYALVRDTL